MSVINDNYICSHPDGKSCVWFNGACAFPSGCYFEPVNLPGPQKWNPGDKVRVKPSVPKYGGRVLTVALVVEDGNKGFLYKMKESLKIQIYEQYLDPAPLYELGTYVNIKGTPLVREVEGVSQALPYTYILKNWTHPENRGFFESELTDASPKYKAGDTVMLKGRNVLTTVTKPMLINNRWHYKNDFTQLPIAEELLEPVKSPLFKKGDMALQIGIHSAFATPVVLLDWDSESNCWKVKSKDSEIMMLPESRLCPLKPSRRPKFQAGDNVIVIESPEHKGKTAEVLGVIEGPAGNCYMLKDLPGIFLEGCIKLYKYNSEDMNNSDNQILGQWRCPKCSKVLPTSTHKCTCGYDPSELPVISFEDPVFDLRQYIARATDRQFYSQCYGMVSVDSVEDTKIVVRSMSNGKKHSLTISGQHYSGKNACLLWPNEALYFKYPLEPVKAWDEWAKSVPPFTVSIMIGRGKEDPAPRVMNLAEFTDADTARKAADALNLSLAAFVSENSGDIAIKP